MSIDRLWELFIKKINGEISSGELEELNALLKDHNEAFQMNEIMAVIDELRFRRDADDQARKRSVQAIRQRIDIGGSESTEEPAIREGDCGGKSLGEIQSDEAGLVETCPAEKRANVVYSGETRSEETDVGEIRVEKPVLTAPVGRSGRVWWLVSLAAAVMACCILLLPFDRRPQSGQENLNSIHTDPGSKTTVNLPDGSTVVLNAGSWLTYNKEFGISSREIHLTGEAFFDIVKKETMPLVVYAGMVEIRVRGTTFNVKAYPDDETIEASLLTGSIELVSTRDPERKILLRPQEKIVVSKKEDIPASRMATKEKIVPRETISLARMKPDPVDSSYAETAWLENKLVFRSETFGVLARRMERRYGVHIEFKEEGLSELIFTGSFSLETVTEALEALQVSASFRYEITDKTIFISK